MEYVLQKSRLGEVVSWSGRRETHQSSGGDTEALARNYFATLSDKELADVFDKYRTDFRMFDYDADEYFEGRKAKSEASEDS